MNGAIIILFISLMGMGLIWFLSYVFRDKSELKYDVQLNSVNYIDYRDKFNKTEQEFIDFNYFNEYYIRQSYEIADRLTEIYFGTQKFILELGNSSICNKGEWTPEVEAEYKDYLYKCKKMNQISLVRDSYQVYFYNKCFCAGIKISNPYPMMYNVIHAESAKYLHNNREKLEKDFQERFYEQKT